MSKIKVLTTNHFWQLGCLTTEQTQVINCAIFATNNKPWNFFSRNLKFVPIPEQTNQQLSSVSISQKQPILPKSLKKLKSPCKANIFREMDSENTDPLSDSFNGGEILWSDKMSYQKTSVIESEIAEVSLGVIIYLTDLLVSFI